jgi:hypothetical protein
MALPPHSLNFNIPPTMRVFFIGKRHPAYPILVEEQGPNSVVFPLAAKLAENHGLVWKPIILLL